MHGAHAGQAKGAASEREATATVVRDLLSAGGVVAVKLGQVIAETFDKRDSYWQHPTITSQL